ncbi:uncharacterized protein LOC111619341 [Centruroides sculpturatus]|uniref:uncharacterized protein LOC111619341 n=1 Tax=Centruroides sculpturatus TaxID=218467 RepID=UPI000C6E9250|nr:uncharacterized protein LOC111619341 [Centruroides sculpturatus]
MIAVDTKKQFPNYPPHKCPQTEKTKRTPLQRNVQVHANPSQKRNKLVDKQDPHHESTTIDTEVTDGPVYNYTDFEEGRKSNMVSAACKTNYDLKLIVTEYKTVNKLKATLWRKNVKLSELQAEHDKNALKLKAYEEVNLIEAVRKIEALAKTGNTGAVFLVDQILNFDKYYPKWSNDVIRECIFRKSQL